MKTIEKQTGVKAEFRTHLITYMAVISFLTVINLFFTPDYFWFIWPMMGWGIAIIIHGISTYLPSNELSQREK